MSWFKSNLYHDGMRLGDVVWLKDTEDVAMRVHLGYLEPADEPEWHKQLPEEDKWTESNSTR